MEWLSHAHNVVFLAHFLGIVELKLAKRAKEIKLFTDHLNSSLDLKLNPLISNIDH